MFSKIFVNPCKMVLIVTMEGFEPSRPCEHHPLKMASLPFLHMALKKKRSFEKRTTFCDPTGARTQDPIIKSDVLYQLSYRVIIISWMRVQI